MAGLTPPVAGSSAPACSWEERFGADRARIERALELALMAEAGCPDRLASAMAHAVLGPGKRLRPVLVLAAARMCGASTDSAMPAAVAVELVHSYSLVHDDLPAMDDDDLRRGRPTVHVLYDEATAILAGDAMIPLAFEVLVRGVQPPSAAIACCGVLAAAAGRGHLVGGQADDLAAEQSNTGWTVERLESIHRRKTGSLIAASLQLGGIVAGASEDQCERLRRFGEQIGLAFQIADDLLDFCGDPSKMGKRVAKDHQRGKLTWPALVGPEASGERANQLVDAALRELEPWGAAAEPLAWLARFVVDRAH